MLLDEADALTLEAQTALRGLIEDLSACNMIILTANYPNQFIEPVRSRFCRFASDSILARCFDDSVRISL